MLASKRGAYLMGGANLRVSVLGNMFLLYLQYALHLLSNEQLIHFLL